MNGVCLDTGVIHIYFSDNLGEKERVKTLLNEGKNHKIELWMAQPSIVELFYQIGKKIGIENARNCILSLFNIFPINWISLENQLLMKAGEIKCRNPTIFSYNDCIMIGFCLLKKKIWHTTEKKKKNIEELLNKRLQIVSYNWD